MAARYDFEEPIWRGDDVAIPIKLADEDAATDPEKEYLDLRGMTLKFTMKLDPTVADEDADLYVENLVPEADVSAEFGEWIFVLPKEKTGQLITAKYTYQVILEIPDPIAGTPTCITFLWGRVPVKDS